MEKSGAGIDVFEEEPTKNKELLIIQELVLLLILVHATKEAQNRIGDRSSFYNKRIF